MDLSDLCTWTHARRVSLGVQLLVSLPFNWFLGPPTGNPDSPEPAMTMHVGPKNQCHRIMNNDRWWNVAVLGCVPGLQKKSDMLMCRRSTRPFSSTKVTPSCLFSSACFLSYFVCFFPWLDRLGLRWLGWPNALSASVRLAMSAATCGQVGGLAIRLHVLVCSLSLPCCISSQLRTEQQVVFIPTASLSRVFVLFVYKHLSWPRPGESNDPWAAFVRRFGAH